MRTEPYFSPIPNKVKPFLLLNMPMPASNPRQA